MSTLYDRLTDHQNSIFKKEQFKDSYPVYQRSYQSYISFLEEYYDDANRYPYYTKADNMFYIKKLEVYLTEHLKKKAKNYGKLRSTK